MSASITWAEAQRRFEEEEAALVELAPLLGVTVAAVSYHSKRYGWTRIEGVEAESRTLACREFVKRNVEAIQANQAEKHALAKRALLLIARHMARLEDDQLWSKVIGQRRDGEDILVHEDPAQSLYTLLRTLKLAEEVDQSILQDAKWRPTGDEPKLPLPSGIDWLALLGPGEEEQIQ